MPSTSEKQRKFMAVVNAYQRGEARNVGSEVRKAAGSMTSRQSRDFMRKPKRSKSRG